MASRANFVTVSVVACKYKSSCGCSPPLNNHNLNILFVSVDVPVELHGFTIKMKTVYVRTKMKFVLLLLVCNLRKHALRYSFAMQLVITQRGIIYFNQTRYWDDSLEFTRTVLFSLKLDENKQHFI